MTHELAREYRKTATIRAVQWWKMGDHPAVVSKTDGSWSDHPNGGTPWIETLEGGHVVSPGDWIATGVKGEHWPIKPDVFAATYEEVTSRTAEPAADVAELLREVRDRGLIYWEPNTERGAIAKADMLRRIDAALQAQPAEPNEAEVERAFLAVMNAQDRELSLPLTAWAERNLLKRRIAVAIRALRGGA